MNAFSSECLVLINLVDAELSYLGKQSSEFFFLIVVMMVIITCFCCRKLFPSSISGYDVHKCKPVYTLAYQFPLIYLIFNS
jgi:hypothetical protein